MPAARLSDKFLSFLDDYCKEHKLKSREEAGDAILQILEARSTPPQSDVPMGMKTDLLDPSLPPETLEARRELIEASKRYELHQLKPPDCPFCAKVNDTQIECGRELRKGKKPMLMLTVSCWACWDRREYVKRKIEKQKDNEPDQEPPLTSSSNLPFKSLETNQIEKLKHGTLEYQCEKDRQRFQMLKLPCMTDLMFSCPFKQCEQRLLKLMQMSNVST